MPARFAKSPRSKRCITCDNVVVQHSDGTWVLQPGGGYGLVHNSCISEYQAQFKRKTGNDAPGLSYADVPKIHSAPSLSKTVTDELVMWRRTLPVNKQKRVNVPCPSCDLTRTSFNHKRFANLMIGIRKCKNDHLFLAEVTGGMVFTVTLPKPFAAHIETLLAHKSEVITCLKCGHPCSQGVKGLLRHFRDGVCARDPAPTEDPVVIQQESISPPPIYPALLPEMEFRKEPTLLQMLLRDTSLSEVLYELAILVAEMENKR